MKLFSSSFLFFAMKLRQFHMKLIFLVIKHSSLKAKIGKQRKIKIGQLLKKSIFDRDLGPEKLKMMNFGGNKYYKIVLLDI